MTLDNELIWVIILFFCFLTVGLILYLIDKLDNFLNNRMIKKHQLNNHINNLIQLNKFKKNK